MSKKKLASKIHLAQIIISKNNDHLDLKLISTYSPDSE